MNSHYFTPLEVLKFAHEMALPILHVGSERVLGPREGSSPAPDGTEIWVKNVPNMLLENRIVAFFSKAGDIYKTRLLLNADGSKNRGSAYITFKTTDAVEKALLLNNTEIIPGFKIKVGVANDNSRIFVGGLPAEKSKQDIWHELLRAGFKNIVDVIMYRSFLDKTKNRGFVFVEFSSHQEAENALKKFKKCAILFGKRVNYNWSTPIQKFSENKQTEEVKTIYIKNVVIFKNTYVNTTTLPSVLKSVLKDDYQTIDVMGNFENYNTLQFKTRRDAKKAICLLKECFKHLNPRIEVGWNNSNMEIGKENLRAESGVPNHQTDCNRNTSSNNFNENGFPNKVYQNRNFSNNSNKVLQDLACASNASFNNLQQDDFFKHFKDNVDAVCMEDKSYSNIWKAPYLREENGFAINQGNNLENTSEHSKELQDVACVSNAWNDEFKRNVYCLGLLSLAHSLDTASLPKE